MNGWEGEFPETGGKEVGNKKLSRPKITPNLLDCLHFWGWNTKGYDPE